MSTVANDPIRAYIVNEFLAGEDAEDLTDDFDLIESTVVNSLGLVRLISWISETYSIPVDDIPLEPAAYRTLADIRGFVSQAAPAAV
ncbi:acyl carrier protein [Streptomyces anulatus]|uniref:acyl carrier protein n=1 Tax=Streptomyces TaxID=1883 RepID=UPI000BEFEE49|nr:MULTISPECIES: acyl carrier protein [Streptomyces]QYA95727.1 acyl carrier protein [Streptomyces anulatus]WSU30536.1 acyl carrier protein [Streptomyces anulatus]WSU90603.1 acyl carrier protein [Streptomyces anulatus]WSV76454.1 acyl carrier protein [Streptomyces anulatus]WSW84451.1 acyl carrier protein [Streptomyces anulatus]